MAKMSLLSAFLLLALFASVHDAQEIGVYELRRGDFSVKFTNYGATLMSLTVPDRNGRPGDIVLGFDSPEGYKNDTTYFGAIVGRVANRIGQAQFTLNNNVYKLVPNDGNNALHGGYMGFHEVIWSVSSYKADSHITFSYFSPDGEEGYPGDLSLNVTYMLIGANKLGIKMEAKPLNKATPVNLATHTYWNLAGQNSGDIFSHEVQLFASRITPVDAELIPTGEITPVMSTPYDFLEPHTIGSRIGEVPGGYDINYVINKGSPNHFSKVARVHERVSGRTLELWTNQPGVQFYSGGMIKDTVGKGGHVYNKYDGFCLETQGFPDSVNHPNFPSQIVQPGQTYEHYMVYRFTAY